MEANPGSIFAMRQVHCLPAFEDNYIWLLGDTDSPYVTVVDPGDADPVLAFLADNGLRPEAILLTHHHGDHTGGVAELLEHHAVPVYGPRGAAIRTVTEPIGDGDRIELPGTRARLAVIDTPGHTRAHACYAGEELLFCGDTLFAGGCGRLFEGTPEQMFESLEKLAALPDETRVYCAHEYTLANLAFALVAEPDNANLLRRRQEAEALRARGEPTVPSTLAEEKRTNPFLRSRIPALRAAAERFSGRTLSTPAQVFAVVRHWKDTLD